MTTTAQVLAGTDLEASLTAYLDASNDIVLVKDTQPLPVAPSSTATFPTSQATGTRANLSSTITTGGTAQTLASARAGRFGYSIQNVSSGNLYVNDLGATATATNSSRLIAPGQTYESPSNDRPVSSISIIGATTDQAFFAYEW